MNNITFTTTAPAMHRSLLSKAAASLTDPRTTSRLSAKERKGIEQRVEEMRSVGRARGWND